MADTKKILVANPGLDVVAGGQGVTAWVLQALVDAGFTVCFATLCEPDFPLMDEAFGTRLARCDSDRLRVAVAPERYRAFLRYFPTRGACLELALSERFTAAQARQDDYDLLIGMNNETNFPVPGLQYIHYPRFLPARPEEDYRWFHYIPGLLNLYRFAAVRLSGLPAHAWRINRSLINSGYIASLFDAGADADAEVLYPPAVGSFQPRPWAERANRFVVVGRMHEAKRVVPLIRILKAVHDLDDITPFEVIFVGRFNCSPEYQCEIENLVAACPWISLRHDLDRTELTELLAGNRYGIHGMLGEHFGMAVAEMQEAGMITFAPNSGGPREILSYDARRLYDSDEDAVAKIAAILRDEQLQESIHAEVAQQAGRFLVPTFCRSFLETVAECLEGR